MNNIKLFYEIIYNIQNQQWNYHSWESYSTEKSDYLCCFSHSHRIQCTDYERLEVCTL